MFGMTITRSFRDVCVAASLHLFVLRFELL